MHRKQPEKVDNRYTIKSLRLDIPAAIKGDTWLLLPEGFRDQGSGKTYPLPSRRIELQKLSSIFVPHNWDKRDCGCLYINRAIKAWKKKQMRSNSAILDIGLRRHQVKRSQDTYNILMKGLRSDARQAVEEVKQEAVLAVASLKDLFSLGREGLDGQMRAHLEGKDWKGETIDAKAFRDCFRMVTSAVKGLGLPSDQKQAATEAVIEEVAAALKSTQETVALSPGPGDEIEN